MIVRLFLFAAIIGAGWIFYQYLCTLDPANRKKVIIKYTLWILIALTVLAVVTGRMHWLGIVFAAALGLLRFGFTAIIRVLPFLKIMGASGHFKSPVFKTPYLEAEFDLSQGTIEGKITDGPCAGKMISALTSEELDQLANHYKELDKRSYYLILVVKQRRSGHYSQTGKGGNYQDAGTPTIAESLQILGLKENPSKQEIIQAHRRLIQKLHPDRGGNNYLASRINLAKDILIKNLK